MVDMLDWDDLRYFLAIERHGNLSAAARELGVAQSTAGRRLASLETSLGTRLLDRTPDGYVLTVAGHDVRERARRLEHEAQTLQRTIGGQDRRDVGLVRITCSEAIAGHILAPSLAVLHRQHPGILIELIPHPREVSLAMREADLSVRITQPTQHDLVIRRIGNLAFGLYASPSYMAEHGELNAADGCANHHMIRQRNDLENGPQFGWLADLTSHAKVVFQTSSHEAAVMAATQGSGLACLARFRADREATLVRLTPPTEPPTAGIWLTVHKDSRQTSRIRTVMTHIAETISTLRAELMPEGSEDTDPLVDGSA